MTHLTIESLTHNFTQQSTTTAECSLELFRLVAHLNEFIFERIDTKFESFILLQFSTYYCNPGAVDVSQR